MICTNGTVYPCAEGWHVPRREPGRQTEWSGRRATDSAPLRHTAIPLGMRLPTPLLQG